MVRRVTSEVAVREDDVEVVRALCDSEIRPNVLLGGPDTGAIVTLGGPM